MKVLKSTPETGYLKLRIDNLDDLWYLHQFLKPGMVAGSSTLRRLEAKDDKLRPEQQQRVRVYIKVKVADVEFHHFSNALRIKGPITAAPEGMSGHHTLTVEPGTILDIEHFSSQESSMELIREAETRTRAPRLLVVNIDDESASLFRVRDYGLEEIGTVRIKSGGKMYASKDSGKEAMDEIIDALCRNLEKGAALVVSGPGFFKEVLLLHMKESGRFNGVDLLAVPSSSGGRQGALEALSEERSRGEALKGIRFAQENEVLGEFFKMVGKGGLATYGPLEVRKALDMNAVDTLLISERVFRGEEARELLKLGHDRGSSLMVISTAHERGVMFDRMGGMGALLRFPIPL